MHVISTAGHIDHGKSSLIRALTGINPDRLREEHERGMTIDLGYAWLTLPSGESVSIVDVPGHEDFVHNMLAGVGAIDAALLVIAADDGVMPQTREHLAILDLLGISAGLVALTKIDLVTDPEWLELVREDILDVLKGTSLAAAPVLPVSVMTREGLSELLSQLDQVLQTVPPRKDLGRPRLFVDRVFTMSGFGTVVTGTLTDGCLKIGDEVEILPRGMKARIRGLQSHKDKMEQVHAGGRVAVNLSRVGKEDLARGDVLTKPGTLRPTGLVDVKLESLPSLPQALKHNMNVDFFCGSARIPAKLRILGTEEIPPGESGWAQLVLSQSVAVARGDRFILRQPSPKWTIAGGTVADPLPVRRHRRFQTGVLAGLQSLVHGTPDELVLAAVQRQEPCRAREVVRSCGLGEGLARETLNRLLQDGQLVVLSQLGGQMDSSAIIAGDYPLISASGLHALLERVSAILGEYHDRYPLRMGMLREELKSRLRLSTRFFNDLLDLGVQRDVLAVTEVIVRLADHEVHFRPSERAAIDRVMDELQRMPYGPPTAAEFEAAVGPEVLHALLEQGILTRVSDDIYFLTTTYDEMVERVVQHIREQGKISIGDVRDMFGSSRKYILPLLNHLDDMGVTRRVGDDRVLRQAG